ncbi:MAG: leucine-rich repeat domain-containing protein, partial [Bacteroidales bacterium]|nr:leucine-rich repeat domain-containing protein [Bacteroidales bacterium]
MIRRILTVAAVLGFMATVSSCTKETENDPITISAKDEVNVSALAGKIVTVDFKTNAIGNAVNPATISVANGEKIKLPKLTLGTEDAKLLELKGWSDGTNFYEPEKEYTVSGNTVFNAVWALKPIKLKDVEKVLAYISDIESDEPIEISLEGSVPGEADEIFAMIMEASNKQKLSLNLSKLDWEKVKISAYIQPTDDVIENKICGLVLPENATSVNIKGTDIKEITIPKYVTSVDIASCYEEHFHKDSKISSIKFADGSKCTEIDLSRLNELESIDLPAGVSDIDIRYCGKLQSINASNATKVNFAFCTALEEVTLDRGIRSITQTAFSGTALKSIVIPETVTKIESSAFQDCKSLQSIVIPSSVESIEDYVFSGCESLTSIEVKVKTGEVEEGDKTVEKVVSLPNVESNVFGIEKLSYYDKEKEELFSRDNLKITFKK